MAVILHFSENTSDTTPWELRVSSSQLIYQLYLHLPFSFCFVSQDGNKSESEKVHKIEREVLKYHW